MQLCFLCAGGCVSFTAERFGLLGLLAEFSVAAALVRTTEPVQPSVFVRGGHNFSFYCSSLTKIPSPVVSPESGVLLNGIAMEGGSVSQVEDGDEITFTEAKFR